METPIFLVVLITALMLSATARFAADALIRNHHEQKADFFRRFPTRPGDIVFIGDSITDGGNWDEIFPGLPVRNRGINADTTSGVLKRLDEVTAGSPAKVFLLIGTNDLALIERRSDRAILANYAEILRRLRAESPETRVHVQSILPRAKRYTERVRRLNAQIEKLAAQHGCAYIDLFPLFAGPDGAIRPELSNDRLHLMGEGYQIWADKIRPFVLA